MKKTILFLILSFSISCSENSNFENNTIFLTGLNIEFSQNKIYLGQKFLDLKTGWTKKIYDIGPGWSETTKALVVKDEITLSTYLDRVYSFNYYLNILKPFISIDGVIFDSRATMRQIKNTVSGSKTRFKNIEASGDKISILTQHDVTVTFYFKSPSEKENSQPIGVEFYTQKFDQPQGSNLQ